QSGGWQFDGLADPAEAESRGLALERALANAESGLDTMLQRSAESVLEAATEVYEDYYFSPVPDPSSLPAPLGELADRGALPSFDLLLGTNADEALMYLESGDTVRKWLAENLEPEQRAAVRDELDPAKSDREQLNRLDTAARFACPSMRLANAVARAGGRSFVYQFTRVRDGFKAVGAYHGAELPYVFDTHDEWLPTRARDRELTAKMVDYWLSFAADGTPGKAGASSWPRWRADSQRVMVLGDTPAVQAFPDAALCRALTGLSR
ncbi:MAG: carboxylesterase family protein, partial [Haliea sp.]